MLIKKKLKTILCRIDHLKLREKLIIYFAASSSCIVILFGVIHYNMTSVRIMKESTRSTAEMVQNACGEVNNLFRQIYEICGVINDNLNMQEFLRKNFLTKKERYAKDLQGSMEMMALSFYNKDLNGVYVFGDNGGRYKSNSASFLLTDPRETSWYRIVHATGKAHWFPPHEASYAVRTPVESYVSLGFPFIDKRSGRTKGVVLAEIETGKLVELAGRSVSGNGAVFFMDERNQIMDFSLISGESNRSWANEETFAEARAIVEEHMGEIPEYGVSHVVENGKMLIIYQTLDQANWKIVGVVSKKAIADSVKYIKILMILLLAAAVMGSLILAEFLADSVTRPIDRLVEAMEAVWEGNLDVVVETRRTDEIGILYHSFNHMVDEMKHMIQTIYKEQRKLRKEELKALQAQINPHFLYNTLDSIIWSMRMNQVTESIEMLEALSDFFKISLSNGQDIITVGEEVRHVSCYLNILHRRYSEKFDYDINVDPELLSNRTPKLILQPIVENAIYHGLKPKEGIGYLYIHIFAKDDVIFMRVEDTGLGIPEELVCQLNQELMESSSEKAGDGYGIRNVNDKLKIVFGRACGVSVESVMGEGTIVTLRIHRDWENFYESDDL